MALTQELKTAIQSHDLSQITGLLQPTGDNTASEALVYTVGYSQYDKDTIECLFNLGADANALNADGIPVLLLAARNKNMDYIISLLNHGSDSNLAAEVGYRAGETALIQLMDRDIQPHEVASVDQCIAFLVQHGADVNVTSRNGATALTNATKTGQLQLVQTMLNFGANIESGSKSSLIIAAENGNIAIVDELIARGANIEAGAAAGYTPLMAAAMQGSTGCLQSLLDAHADVTIHTNYGLSVIGMAASNFGNGRADEARECIELLSNHGATFEFTPAISQALSPEDFTFMENLSQELIQVQQTIAVDHLTTHMESLDLDLVGDISSESAAADA
jgi:hypothetical protein